MSTGPSTGPVGLIGSDWLIGLRQNHLFIFAIAYLVIPSLELRSLPESPALVSRGSLGLEAGSCFSFVLPPVRPVLTVF